MKELDQPRDFPLDDWENQIAFQLELARERIGELDQFARKGNQISPAYLEKDKELRSLFEQSGVSKGAYARTLGDLLFLIEGGLANNGMV